jgi:phospholipid transport system substrate-binding protein
MSKIFLIVALLFSSGAWAAQDAATELVQKVSERMLTTLEKRRAEIDRNPSLIYGLVDDILVPHFDFQKITQAAVGKHWRKATPGQKKALTEGFQQVLIRTYAKALLSYSDEKIRYLPVKPGKRKSTVTVSTEVREPGGPTVPVDYRMHNNGGGWKVYDVVIDNVSLISNYRSSFNTQIRRDGIDGLIRSLSEMNTKGQA